MRFKRLLTVGLMALLGAGTATAASQLNSVQVTPAANAATVNLRTTGSYAHKEYRPDEHLMLVDLTGVTADPALARLPGAGGAVVENVAAAPPAPPMTQHDWYPSRASRWNRPSSSSPKTKWSKSRPSRCACARRFCSRIVGPSGGKRTHKLELNHKVIAETKRRLARIACQTPFVVAERNSEQFSSRCRGF